MAAGYDVPCVYALKLCLFMSNCVDENGIYNRESLHLNSAGGLLHCLLSSDQYTHALSRLNCKASAKLAGRWQESDAAHAWEKWSERCPGARCSPLHVIIQFFDVRKERDFLCSHPVCNVRLPFRCVVKAMLLLSDSISDSLC